MDCNFDLGQEVWWFQESEPGQITIRSGQIHGIRWSRARIRKRKLFCVDNHEVEVNYLYHSKLEAIESMIDRLESHLELDAGTVISS